MPRDAASNEASGPHQPHRGHRPLPQQLARTGIGAGVWWERACPRCSFERSQRPASAPSRPQAAPTTARPDRHRSRVFVGAGLPAIAASNKARGPHPPHRGQRPPITARPDRHRSRGLVGAGLPAMQLRTKSTARIRPIAARGRPQQLALTGIGAGFSWERACPRLRPRTKPTARISPIAARGRSHNSSPGPASEPGFGGSGLARDCGLEQSPRPASAPSRPETAPTTARPNDAVEKPHSGASSCFRPSPVRSRSSSFQSRDLRFIVVS